MQSLKYVLTKEIAVATENERGRIPYKPEALDYKMQMKESKRRNKP
jgi:hypothetical protein